MPDTTVPSLVIIGAPVFVVGLSINCSGSNFDALRSAVLSDSCNVVSLGCKSPDAAFNLSKSTIIVLTLTSFSEFGVLIFFTSLS